jgi:uncharacterized protein
MTMAPDLFSREPSSSSASSIRTNGQLEIEVAGERLILHPEKVLWWPARRTLFLADTHFGKAATFRAHGVPISDETLQHDLGRLSSVIDSTGCQRLIVLGDLIHARRGRSPVTLNRVSEWRRAHPAIAIELVRGNHDRAAGPPLDDWNITILPDSFRDGPFVCRHDPVAAEDGFVLAGHLHPKILLPLEAGGKVKLACFWRRPGLLVLPAFGSFIDSAVVQPENGDSVYAVGEGAVHDVTSLTSSRRWKTSRS